MTTGDRMKSRRKELDIPVEEIASALGISIATVYRYENGDIEKLPGHVLDPLARILRTTPAYLMGWDESADAREDSKKIMAANIKRYMSKKGVSNQQLCDALDFKYTTFLDWINAVTYPRISKVEAMANYFGCEKSDLIEKEKESSPDELQLTEGETALIQLFRKIPQDKQRIVIEMIRAALSTESQSL